MSDEDALIRGVLDVPDDDAPRLVYADWLDEQGEPERAAFIRAQVALARMPDEPCAAAVAAGRARCNDCGWCRLRDRECELLTRPNGRTWTPVAVREAVPHVGVDILNIDDDRPWGFGVRFIRGFVGLVRADGDTLIRVHAVLRANTPVTTFELTWMPSVQRIGEEFVRPASPGGLRPITFETRGECLKVLWPGIQTVLIPRRPLREPAPLARTT